MHCNTRTAIDPGNDFDRPFVQLSDPQNKC